MFVFLSLGALGLAFLAPITKAAPILSVSSSDAHLTLTVPKGGGTITTSTTLTASTVNATGYTLTASLPAEELGISLSLKGGAVTDDTILTVGATPLILATTSQITDPTAPDTTDLTLTVTVDDTVTEGTKELKLTYAIVDNDPAEPETPPVPTTMQSMTSDYCQNHMQIYTAQDDEDKILRLTDNRGGITQTYEVAKLADNNCWMLNNLKLGSTTEAIELTPEDTNIAVNFTLPQVTTTDTGDYDNPTIYGPVPGDTGTGATNYGYLYNWVAATAGESRITIPSMPHDDETGMAVAPYSICPAGWKLPTVVSPMMDTGTFGEYADLDRAFGGDGVWAENGEPSFAKWQYDGPFRGVKSGLAWAPGIWYQGAYGGLWSSTVNVWWGDDLSFSLYFDDGGVGVGAINLLSMGFGVRCLLQ